jgi:hypothetical protein
MLTSVAREGLAIMTRLFWQLGEEGEQLMSRHHQWRRGEQ